MHTLILIVSTLHLVVFGHLRIDLVFGGSLGCCRVGAGWTQAVSARERVNTRYVVPLMGLSNLKAQISLKSLLLLGCFMREPAERKEDGAESLQAHLNPPNHV